MDVATRVAETVAEGRIPCSGIWWYGGVVVWWYNGSMIQLMDEA